MATPIKQVPILTGKLAEEFDREADENAKLPRHELTPERAEYVKRMLRQIDNYRFPWDK